MAVGCERACTATQVDAAIAAATAAQQQQAALPAVAAAASAAAAHLAGGAGAASSSEADAQRRQAYAEAVFQRFMAKLEGREAGQGKVGTGQEGGPEPLSVGAQVSALIRDATSLDNLSQMYEGWSAWI